LKKGIILRRRISVFRVVDLKELLDDNKWYYGKNEKKNQLKERVDKLLENWKDMENSDRKKIYENVEKIYINMSKR
jgi:hypothetical protein